MFNYQDRNDRVDFTEPWYKNEGSVSPLIFLVFMAIGLFLVAIV